jgi:hypothetical protein
LSFPEGWPGDNLAFIDEFELPPRAETERGGAPDYAVTWHDVAWLVELKTERASHRRGQILSYFELCRYHHPTCRVSITYLTPLGEYALVTNDDWARYAHVAWPEVALLIRDIWPYCPDEDKRAVVQGLLDAIDRLDLTPAQWRAKVAAPPLPREPARSPLDEALELARLSAEDGTQRALDRPASSLEELQGLRLEVRDALAATAPDSPLRHVMPWLWQPASTGRPMTSAGADNGYELRLSRYNARLY